MLIHENEEEANRPPLIDLKLRCNELVLNRLYDVFDSDCINSNVDGSYDITVTIHEDEWVYGYILSLGKSVEVLAPEHIRKIIKTHAMEIAKKY